MSLTTAHPAHTADIPEHIPKKNRRRRILLSIVVVLLIFILGVPAVGGLIYVQAHNGVITTNFPAAGGTIASLSVRLFPNIAYGDYSNMETDPTAVSAAERDSVLATAKALLPSGVDLVSLNTWNEVQEGLNAVQIVNNVPISGSTYTIVLPQNWRKSARMPLVLSGNGAGVSNNQRLWSGADVSVIQLVGMASQPGRTGLIGAYSNAGGTESQGIDDHSYQSVGAFFDFIAQNGGDPQHTITAGGSRGGGTALMWAINPKKLNYAVQAVFADIPPTAYGLLSQQSVLTYPNLGYIYEAATHDQSAYLYSSPNGPSHPALHVLIGVDDPTQADAISPIGMAQGLKGKIVVLGRGTHDAFFPLREFLAFDRHLNDLGIDHTTVITLGQGHTGNTFLADQLTAYVDALSQGKTYQPPTGRFYFIDLKPPTGTQVPLAEFLKNGLNADPKAAAVVGGDLPFAAEIPRYAGPGNPIDISVCGKPGTSYSFSAKDSSGGVWTQASGTFDGTECAYQRVNAPTTGQYTWSFTYGGQPIPSTNTPFRDSKGCGLAAVTTVLAQQPSPADINGDSQTLGFGVDQYSAQAAGCAAGS